MNNRRKLVFVLSAGVFAMPIALLAQQSPKIARIGFLGNDSASGFAQQVEAFRAGLRELGYVEGKNIVIEYRWAEGNLARLPDLANELVRSKVDVMVTNGTPGGRAAQHATTTIPIVIINVGDPVGFGFVKSLARPGGNITGLSGQSAEFVGKQLELLLEIVPKGTRVAVLGNTDNTGHAVGIKHVQTAAQRTGTSIQPLFARTPLEIENAFAMMVGQKSGAVIVMPTPLSRGQRSQFAELSLKARLPSITTYREQVEGGMLMSYGPDVSSQFVRAASYVDKILKGAKPGDLPVEQPTTFDLAVNMKTAKTLGIKIPNSILVQATKVIE